MNKSGFFISSRAHAWLGDFPVGSGPSYIDEAKFSLESLQEIVYEASFPSGLVVKAARDGFIGMGFDGIVGFLSPEEVDKKRRPDENWSLAHLNARIPVGDAINAFLACLNGALQNSSDICELGYVPNNRLANVDHDLLPTISQTSDVSARRGARYPWFYKKDDFPPAKAWCNQRHIIIGVDDLQKAAEAVNTLLCHSDRGAVKLVSLYNWAVGSLSELDYARSLITSWAVTERILEVIWLDFIKKNSAESSERVLDPPSSGKRAHKLKGNNMTASIRVEILSIAGHLSEWEYTHIEKSRRARNEWIHSLETVTFQNAIEAAAAAAVLINRIYDVTVQTKYQVYGQ